MNNSRFYQISDFYPYLQHPEKYVGKSKKITARSSWEIRMMQWLDGHPDIINWTSEESVLQYISPVDGKKHRYFIDFWLKLKQKDGTIKELLIEIKPYAQTIAPVPGKRKTQNFYKQVNTYLVNQAKWETARSYCKQLRETEGKNIDFQILTEKDIKFT